MPKVLIVDDHATLRRGLRALLETHPGRKCCAEADSGEEAIRAAAEFKPDVIIMDVSMPRMGGVKAKMKRLRQVESCCSRCTNPPNFFERAFRQVPLAMF
jgi:YesN/AraC family two-component response regulator